MTFTFDEDFIALLLEFEHYDDFAIVVVSQELDGHRTRSQFGEDIATECEVLLGLHCADAVRSAFGLHGNDVLLARMADADIQFVRLDLSDIGHGRPQMALQRIGHNAQKQVDQPAVTTSRGLSVFTDSDETSR